jgi:hypothetical protein
MHTPKSTARIKELVNIFLAKGKSFRSPILLFIKIRGTKIKLIRIPAISKGIKLAV